MKEQRVFLLEPAAVLKPWGLRSRRIKQVTGCSVGIGEIWIASAQDGPGNVSNRIPAEKHITLAHVLMQADPANGQERAIEILGAKAVEAIENTPLRGKTEAWYIRKVVGRVGVVGGPQSAEGMAWLKARLSRGAIAPNPGEWPEEMRKAFGVIEPVKEGDAFLVKPGTIHTMFGIDEGSYMIIDEIQQGYGDGPLPTLSKILLVENSILSLQLHPSDDEVAQNQKSQDLDVQDLATNPTVRLYDFERDRETDFELGLKLARPGHGLSRPETVTFKLPGGAVVAVMVVDEHFVKERVTIPEKGEYTPTPRQDSYRILHCAAGDFTVHTDRGDCAVKHGQTVLLCANAESSTVTTMRGTVIIHDFYPDLGSYVDFLKARGDALDGNLDKLLNPPPAYPG